MRPIKFSWLENQIIRGNAMQSIANIVAVGIQSCNTEYIEEIVKYLMKQSRRSRRPQFMDLSYIIL